MKKINYIYTLLFLVFLSLLSEGLGWSNVAVSGTYYYDRKYDAIYGKDEYGTDEWYNYHRAYWEMYDFDIDYSSHDWIADQALKLADSIFNPDHFKWIDDNGKPFWDPEGRRRKIFLYATAGPDWGNVICIETKSGTVARAKKTSRDHHYYFDANKNPSEPFHGDEALRLAKLAIKAIFDGDCDLGAFYMGLMAHHMADASLFGHTIPNSISVDGLETYMAARMDNCPGIGEASTQAGYSDEYQYEFLDIHLDVNPFWISPLAPDVGARDVAYQTRFDSVPGFPDGEHTATWMDQQWSQIPREVKLAAASYWAWKVWEHADPVEQKDFHDAYHFFNRLKTSVSFAVDRTARAMQYVIHRVGSSYKCALGVQDMMDQVSRQTTIGVVFMLVSYLGMHLVEIFMRSSDGAWVLVAWDVIIL